LYARAVFRLCHQNHPPAAMTATARGTPMRALGRMCRAMAALCGRTAIRAPRCYPAQSAETGCQRYMILHFDAGCHLLLRDLRDLCVTCVTRQGPATVTALRNQGPRSGLRASARRDGGALRETRTARTPRDPYFCAFCRRPSPPSNPIWCTKTWRPG
jgi:hypothetical protein